MDSMKNYFRLLAEDKQSDPTSGVLSGTGQVGAVSNNGTVQPGAGGTGTLRADSYSGPGTLAFHINGTSTSKLSVLGAADITGDTLSVSASNIMTGRYTILSAGSLMGNFTTLNVPNSVFLAFKPSYTPTDVLLDVTNNGTNETRQNHVHSSHSFLFVPFGVSCCRRTQGASFGWIMDDPSAQAGWQGRGYGPSARTGQGVSGYLAGWHS